VTINQRILTYFGGIFLVFSFFIILLEYRYSQNIATEKLCDKLEICCDVVKVQYDKSEIPFLPDSTIRITILDIDGNIIFDNQIVPKEYTNHSNRKEFAIAKKQGQGFAIRKSDTTKQSYFYYIKKYNKHYIRTAKPFNRLSDVLETDNLAIILILFFFLSASGAFYMVARRFGNTINALKNLIEKVDSGDRYNFPDNEFREISEYIVNMYKRLDHTQKALNMEREKLMSHLKLSKRGLAIFSPQRKEILSNELFIQYINLISDKQRRYPESVFDISQFGDITEFLDDRQRNDTNIFETKSIQIHKNDSIISIHCIIFPDKSFEITIDDITQQEEQALLKRQLTQNISHELKTPISSIQGFMETLLNNPDMEEDKKTFYIERCYNQAIRLSYLLQDISMLNKLDEASNIFAKDDLDLHNIIDSVVQDVALELEEKNFNVHVDVASPLPIKGNQSLLYSVFRNLLDNSLHYAGSDINIEISCYRSDKEFYYLSFADNGVGIEETHLNRIFDRFYRVDKGRSRKLGGTGLGLAIVKNAIHFHQGRISAKNRQGGGLEFLFTLRKE